MNTEFESYLPLFYAIPEKWDDAKPFFSEALKKIADIVNTREIGWLLNEELLNGQQFISSSSNTQDYRSVFRKVINTGALIIGVNTIPHGITFDNNFTLIHMYGAATDNALPRAVPIPNGATSIYMDANNIVINSTDAYLRSFVVIEYLKEL